MFKEVNHIAIYTRNRDEAVDFYKNVLGMEILFELVSPSDGIKIAMARLGSVNIEILEDPAHPDPASELLNSQNHFAMEVDNIEEAHAYLKENGAVMEERGIYSVPDFGGRDIKVAFFHGPNDERIEILQYVK